MCQAGWWWSQKCPPLVLLAAGWDLSTLSFLFSWEESIFPPADLTAQTEPLPPARSREPGFGEGERSPSAGSSVPHHSSLSVPACTWEWEKQPWPHECLRSNDPFCLKSELGIWIRKVNDLTRETGFDF